MKKTTLLFLLICAFCTLNAQTASKSMNAKTMIDKMLATIDGVKTAKFNLKQTERWGSKEVITNNFVKLNVSPFKVYLKDTDKGIELLYLNGWNDGNCFINPNGFPWVNVSFAPLSDRVRESQHHTVFEIGFAYIAKTMRALIKRVNDEKKDFNNYFKYIGDINANGKNYYQLQMAADEFAWIDYKVETSMTPREIAQKLNLDEHIIEEKNGIGHGKIKVGKSIKIPNVYAKKVIFYLDKSTFLPEVQIIYDDKGQYEKYEYFYVNLNPSFANDEFSKDFKDYGF